MIYSLARAKLQINELLKPIFSGEEIIIQLPPKNVSADLSVPLFNLAKKRKISPADISQEIISKINLSESIFQKLEFNAGYLNFHFANGKFAQSVFKDFLESCDKYGKNDLGKDYKVNIEFISANPTGPLTLGNGRGGFCGDTLARVFENYGAKVDCEYYVNDRGVQIENLGHSVLKDDKAVYQGAYIDKLHKQIASGKQTAAAIGVWASEKILEGYIKKTLVRMNIKFNSFFSEQSLYDKLEVEKFLGLLESKGYLEEKDDAIWFKSQKFGDDKDRVLKKKDGEFTYFASDIAYHADKIKRNYDICINFWGADHAGYVPRLEGAVNEILKKELNWAGKFKVIIFQLVRLIKNGKEVRMSKRAGNVILLDELLDEVGVDAARFFFLMYGYNTHMNFDLGLAKKKSRENPVYYVQYAHARIASILKKAKKISTGKINPELLTADAEKALIKKLAELPQILEEIVADYQVQKLPAYAIELADAFHNFYEKCPIIKAENIELSAARLALANYTKIAFKNTLSLMGISVPEKM